MQQEVMAAGARGWQQRRAPASLASPRHPSPAAFGERTSRENLTAVLSKSDEGLVLASPAPAAVTAVSAWPADPAAGDGGGHAPRASSGRHPGARFCRQHTLRSAPSKGRQPGQQPACRRPAWFARLWGERPVAFQRAQLSHFLGSCCRFDNQHRQRHGCSSRHRLTNCHSSYVAGDAAAAGMHMHRSKKWGASSAATRHPSPLHSPWSAVHACTAGAPGMQPGREDTATACVWLPHSCSTTSNSSAKAAPAAAAA